VSFDRRLVDFSLRRPKIVMWALLAATLVAAIGFVRISVDTDPENMLPADDPVRLRNAQLEDDFGAGPMIVVGLFGDVLDADGVAAIMDVHDDLVADPDVVASSTVSLRSIAATAPGDQGDVDALVAIVEGDQLLAGNVLFADGDGAALFVGLTDKNVAVEVASLAEELVAAEPALDGVDVAVGGLPLAEDAFGKQMFVQMAIFAPLAGMLVFLLMWFFFRRLMLVLPAMLLAMATVTITMGLLVGAGNSLHIMSSMIPIFLMPIAILDSVHVASDFFDRFPTWRERGGTRRDLIVETMGELSRPLGYTSLTTAVGFAALALVPIPPVRVFGIFVAIGVGVAWLLTMTFLPAFLVTVDERRLVRPGTSDPNEPVDRSQARLSRIGRAVVRRRVPVLIGAAAIVAVTAPGLASLTVNDNPVRWFRSDHEVRVASERLGESLPGTFTANLLVTETEPGALDDAGTRDSITELVDVLREHDEVGAVQSYVDGDHPMLRADDSANIRLQLRSGDNVEMEEVVDLADRHLESAPIEGVEIVWAGEAYLNLTWQQKMVSGMLVGFATTLGVIFALLVLLFRSLRWALLAIMPVLATVVVVYGALAWAGRDMDMPLAVLSTMVLGIGVDFAIHFVERFRALRERLGSTSLALREFYLEPAQAMTRNAVVIAVGFAPLLLSSLVPYVVVGALLASIILLSWLASIVVLPAIVSYSADPLAESPVA
jgi:predicted RND superfamily exporter protein